VPRVSLATVAREWGRIGEFEDAFAACSLLPRAGAHLAGQAVPLLQSFEQAWQWVVPAGAGLALLRVAPIWVLVAGGLTRVATTL
jgi:hypothetical protein